jgi:hypothetical protein
MSEKAKGTLRAAALGVVCALATAAAIMALPGLS